FHSSRLYPTEQRNSFLLPKDNDGLIAKFRHNEQVIDEMISMLFAYYDHEPGKQNIPIEFAEVNFKSDKQDDPVTKIYLQKLQDKFVNKFIHWKMIPTERGFLSIHDDYKFVVLKHDIYSTLSDESIKNYIPALVSYASSSSRTLPSEKVVEWSRIVYGWKPDETSYYVSLEDVCKVINGKGDKLRSFLLLLKELGQTGTEILARYSLIPNREGNLCKTVDLKDAVDITKELYTLSRPLLGQRASKLVDIEYADIAILPKYGRTNLKEDLKNEIDDLRRKTIKRVSSSYYGTTANPISLNEATSLGIDISDLLKFCSAFPKEGTDTFRARILPIICRIYKKQYEPSLIPALSEDEADFYSSAFNFLIDNTLFVLSRKPETWFKDEVEGKSRLSLLKDFLAEFTNTTDKDRLGKLDEYGIIPNRNLLMCLPKELKKSDSETIPVRILDLYKSLASLVSSPIKDYREVLVHEEFESFYPFKVCKTSEITDEMEAMLREKDDDYSWETTRKIVLDIIEGIDNNEWSDKDVFRDIRAKKPTIFFKNAVSGEKGKHVYTLMRQDEAVIEDLATLAEEPNFAEIVGKARALLLEKQQEESDFEFKKKIGNHIEALLRKRLNESVNNDEFCFPDVQNGQDIVVMYKEKPIYRIEVKTKWNFTTSGPAYMSRNQVMKACEDPERYALCCVDLTNSDLPDKYYPESLDVVMDRIKMKFDIGQTLDILMKPSKEAIEHDPENNVAIDGDFKARIPAGAFRKGETFDALIEKIIKLAKDSDDGLV
ncbi:MAG: hypothetical protein J6N46_01410, partial [Bacteroidales bacterium]|nr:hypothetical protein [Bacteroidales bacterium]